MGADVSTDEVAGIMKIGNHRAPFAVKLGKIWPILTFQELVGIPLILMSKEEE